jgi:hypothetical protein
MPQRKHHGAGDVGGFGEIVRCTVEISLKTSCSPRGRRAARHLVLELGPGHQVTILDRRWMV